MPYRASEISIHRPAREAFLSTRRAWHLLAFALLVGLGTLGLGAVGAQAAAPYTEVTRFGGFEEGGSGAPTLDLLGPDLLSPVSFGVPVGFAVEAENSLHEKKNSVYVLDRMTYKPPVAPDTKTGEPAQAGEVRYRIQKISSEGVLEASTQLPAEVLSYEAGAYFDGAELDAHPLVFLAVDPNQGRVYTLVEQMQETGAIPAGLVKNERTSSPAADELVAWSTTPVDGELVPASGFTKTDPITGAALVAEGLDAGGTASGPAVPEGLAIDPENQDVVIEAQHGWRIKEEFNLANELTAEHWHLGPTELERVVSEGVDSGQVEATRWEASSGVAPPAKAEPEEIQQGDGLFAAASGSYGVALYEAEHRGGGTISNLLQVPAGLAGESLPLIEDEGDTREGHAGKIVENLDEAPSINAPETVNGTEPEGASAFSVYAAGSPLAEVHEGPEEGYYALRFAPPQGRDPQTGVEPWTAMNENPLSYFWEQSSLEGRKEQGPGNVGIRLMDTSGQTAATIGGGGGPCSINAEALSVAAGSEGKLFVLTQPTESGARGDEVIVFEPTPTGTSSNCPQASGEIEVGGVPATTAHVISGTPVKFSALGINRAGETPFEIAWNFGKGLGYTVIHSLGPISEGGEVSFPWPDPEAQETFTGSPGTEFHVNLRVAGDYGTEVFPLTVEIVSHEPPVASFSSSPSGLGVTFNASASTPGSESSIERYEWEFGEGGPAVPEFAAHVSHEYKSSGAYHVKLTVVDVNGETATVEHEVTVTGAGTTTTGTTTTGTTTGTTSTATTTTGTTTTGGTATGATTTGTTTTGPSTTGATTTGTGTTGTASTTATTGAATTGTAGTTGASTGAATTGGTGTGAATTGASTTGASTGTATTGTAAGTAGTAATTGAGTTAPTTTGAAGATTGGPTTTTTGGGPGAAHQGADGHSASRPTKAQKRAKALKACKREKSKKQRSGCEKRIRKKYGA